MKAKTRKILLFILVPLALSLDAYCSVIKRVEARMGMKVLIYDFNVERGQVIQALESLENVDEFKDCAYAVAISDESEPLRADDVIPIAYYLDTSEMNAHIRKNCRSGSSIRELEYKARKAIGMHAMRDVKALSMTRKQYSQGLKTLSKVSNLESCGDYVTIHFENGRNQLKSPTYLYYLPVRYNQSVEDMEKHIREQCIDLDVAFENI